MHWPVTTDADLTFEGLQLDTPTHRAADLGGRQRM